MDLLVSWQIFLLRNIWEIMRHGTGDTRFVFLSWLVWSMWRLTYHALDCKKIMNLLFSLLLSKNVAAAMLLLGSRCSGVLSVHVFLNIFLGLVAVNGFFPHCFYFFCSADLFQFINILQLLSFKCLRHSSFVFAWIFYSSNFWT